MPRTFAEQSVDFHFVHIFQICGNAGMELLYAQMKGLHALILNCFVIVVNIYIVMMEVMRSPVVCIPNHAIILRECVPQP